ncbi:MAG: glycine zipper 2TM domain-containing protein [Magnetospirillum sp.]|nr:glycine zipper 2TM domain-containing protein [Magnetospirillum sp.]
MTMRNVAVAIALSLSLAACAQPGPYGGNSGGFGLNKSTGGGVLGAVGGGLAGAQFGRGKGQLAMTAAGTLLGAFLGSQVGQSLDRADEMYANRAGQQAFETAPMGRPIAWNNPDSGAYGNITPTRTFQAAPSQYCREYHQTVVVGGQQQESYGTACRQPDGSWKVMN